MKKILGLFLLILTGCSLLESPHEIFKGPRKGALSQEFQKSKDNKINETTRNF
ncbi:hypothetical protein [Cetobacterium ceti]